MPFVRYARDKRGYETLYVMHVFDDGRGRPRVLYACRTVPYARVGRAPLDETVQRRIQAAYPALSFEWPRLLKEAAASAPRPEKPDTRGEPRKGRGRDRERKPREPRARQRADAPPAVPPVARTDVPEVTPVPPVRFDPAPEPESEAQPVPAEPPVPESAPSAPMVLGALVVERAWPVVEVIGEGRALILRGRYLELANRVLSRVTDSAEQRRLWDEAARLNPEGWTTAEHARDAAAGFDAAYEAIAARIRQQPTV